MNRREQFWFWLAWRVPARLVYFCVVRAAVETEPKDYPGDKTALEMLAHLTAGAAR